jgi:tubulin--tyrosine ligase-like protein 12
LIIITTTATTSDLVRKAHLVPWRGLSPDFQSALDSWRIFVSKSAVIRKFPEKYETQTVSRIPNFLPPKPLRVFTDMELIKKNLNITDYFQFTETSEDAQVIFLGTSDFISFGFLKDGVFVNQFQNERSIVYKHLLAETLYSYWGVLAHNFFPQTFNLETQLPQFVAAYNEPQPDQQNYWILKPWNMARGLDTIITNNLDCIIRMSETGPKIVQKCN